MKLLPAGDERRKDMARGAFVGMMLPSLILVIVLLRQFGADSTVTSRDSGAPLEIQERLHPIVKRPPVRRVYAGGRNNDDGVGARKASVWESISKPPGPGAAI